MNKTANETLKNMRDASFAFEKMHGKIWNWIPLHPRDIAVLYLSKQSYLIQGW